MGLSFLCCEMGLFGKACSDPEGTVPSVHSPNWADRDEGEAPGDSNGF